MPVPVDDSVALVYRDRYVYLVSGWHETVQRQSDAALRYCNRHLASGHVSGFLTARLGNGVRVNSGPLKSSKDFHKHLPGKQRTMRQSSNASSSEKESWGVDSRSFYTRVHSTGSVRDQSWVVGVSTQTLISLLLA